uniref:RRM domain-containing protein n=1 Tax=Ciona intestinalis TaxID=7719 RepID=F6Y7T8_CIOIN
MSYRSRVYIGRLSHRARENDVEHFFRGYGKINDLMLKNGFGFVIFDDERDADDAIHDLNGKSLCGERVMLEIAKGTPRGPGAPPDSRRESSSRRSSSSSYYQQQQPRSSTKGIPNHGYRLIVENLSSRVTWQDLKDYMRQCGEVVYADANRYRRNEGVVEFSSRKEMKYAIEKLNGTEINGRHIKLTPNIKSPSRSRSRSGSRGRKSGRYSRSRSRSGSRDKSKRSSSRSRSRSPKKAGKRSASKDNHNGVDKRKHSPHSDGSYRSRSRTGSPDGRKSASRSP